jgi:hypothetical protein
MNQILGPISGVYVAAYTVNTHAGHLGIAKLCGPASVSEAISSLPDVQEGPFMEKVSALVIAVDQAVEKARHLTQAD